MKPPELPEIPAMPNHLPMFSLGIFLNILGIILIMNTFTDVVDIPFIHKLSPLASCIFSGTFISTGITLCVAAGMIMTLSEEE